MRNAILGRCLLLLLITAVLSACASGVMSGAGQGGRSADGRSYEAARADHLLAAQVNRALVRDKSVRAMDIRVSVRDGVVSLTGHVPETAMADRARQLAASVQGVQRVDNRLRVGP